MSAVRLNIVRLGVLTLLALCLSLPGSSQPLVEGVTLSGDRYFLDSGLVGILKADKTIEKRVPPHEIGPPSDIFSLKTGPNKDSAVLVLGETGFALVGLDITEVLLDSREFVQQRLGDDHLLVSVPPNEFRIYSLSDPSTPHLLTLESVNDDVQIAVSDNRALIWSPSSRNATVMTSDSVRHLELPERPALGTMALPNGAFLFGGKTHLMSYGDDDELRPYAQPFEEGSDLFLGASFLYHNENLHALYVDGEQMVALTITPEHKPGSSKITTQKLGDEQRVIALGSPADEPPYLLTETAEIRDTLDDRGRLVYDLKAPTLTVKPKVVNGYRLYGLSEDDQWNLVEEKAHSKVVGPVQELPLVLLFAVQDEEELRREGELREVDHRYRFPKVILHARLLRDLEPAWILDLPRGEAPSPARLPNDERWPLMDITGPLFFTTEDDRLAAVDINTGDMTWFSSIIPLDESRPKILKWGESFGVVAATNTTQKLFVFEDDGERVSSYRLNDIFNKERTWNLIGVLAICLALLVYIYLAGKKELFIRRIAGLEALDEAVGRATEMGKPVLYVNGLADVDDIQTLAALSILSHVAKKTAEYDTEILATTARAVTFSAAQEVVRDAFTLAGRPDSFSLESVRYISDDQFGYAAGVDGMMLREEPAANFYMGKFYAESLIFAETGNQTGAIQIAGTAQANQLPFFVAACDYTLIGEELFAASAYLSGDPLQIGSLRGQDVGKAIVMFLLVALSLDATFGWPLSNWVLNLFGGTPA